MNSKQTELDMQPQMIQILVRLIELSHGTMAKGIPIVPALRMNVINTKESAVAYAGQLLYKFNPAPWHPSLLRVTHGFIGVNDDRETNVHHGAHAESETSTADTRIYPVHPLRDSMVSHFILNPSLITQYDS